MDVSGEETQLPEQDALSDLVDSAAIGIHFVDAQGTILWANPADYEPLGYQRDEYVGRAITEFHADAEVIEDIPNRLSRGERLHQYEARLRCKDGSTRWVEIDSSVRFAEGEGTEVFLHTRCFTHDITRRKRLEEAQALLLQAGQSLSESLDVEDILDTLGQLVVPGFADWYAVHLVNERGEITLAHIAHADTRKIELAWQAAERWPDLGKARYGPGRVIRDGRPSLIHSIDAKLLELLARDPGHLDMLRRAGLSSAMGVPLRVADRIIGAITFIAAESKRRYHADDLAVAEALANRAALAMGNARLHQEATEARQRAEQAANRLGLLARASEFIAESLEPEEALQQLARFATSTLADYAVTYWMEQNGNIRRVGLSHADASLQPLVEALDRAGPPRLTDAHGVGAVLRSGKPALESEITDETVKHGVQNPEHLRVVRELAPRSTLIVPLEARGRMLGGFAFTTTDRSGRRYDEADLVLAEELARRMALLIDNARLYSEAKAADTAKEQMLAVVSHDLRSPLQTIVTASDLLGLEASQSQRRKTQSLVRRAATEMGRLLEDLLDATRIREGRLELRRSDMDVRELIEHLLTLHATVAEDRGIRLLHQAPESPLRLHADRARLGQALSNLVDNALKFTPRGGTVTLLVEAVESGVLIAVADTGPGIAPDQLAHVFDRFWRSEPHRPGGIGLGLAIAKGVVEGHGGSLSVESIVDNGSIFRVLLPRDEPSHSSENCSR